VPLGLTALPRSLLGHIAQKVEWEEAPDGHRETIETLWIKKHSNLETKENKQHSIPIGGQAEPGIVIPLTSSPP
jgi:hypothetical protein